MQENRTQTWARPWRIVGTSGIGACARLALVLTLLTLVVGCTQDSQDTTAIHVTTVRDPALSVGRVTFRVFAPEADPRSMASLTSFTAEGAALDRPFVVEADPRDISSFLLVVQAFGLDDPRAVVVEQHVRARFEQGKTLALRVLLSRACASVFCSDDSTRTCYGEARDGIAVGRCGPVPGPYALDEVNKPVETPTWGPTASADAGVREGMDGSLGSLDAAIDAAVDAAACSIPDGSICNPVARCGCGAGLHCQSQDEVLQCTRLPAVAILEERPCQDKSQCGEGLSCWTGLCRPYCFSNADCPAGGVCGLGDKGFGNCYRPCEPGASSCAEGGRCAALNLKWLKGNFCAVPRASCEEYVADGECDEPGTGTGVCAAGTDSSDCCAAKGTNVCDLVTQCGCKKEKSCIIASLVGATASFGCGAAGNKPLDALCDDSSECSRGLGCIGGSCRKFCRTNAECGDGRCFVGVAGQGAGVPGVRGCVTRCDFASGGPCDEGMTCTRFDSGDFCFRTLETCDPGLIGNGKCDETSRLCPVGTDSDCPR